MTLLDRIFLGVIKREFALAMKQKSEVVQPLIFLLIIITLFPIGVSPSPALLQKIGPGVIWIAALLSTLLSLDRIFRDDFHDGTLEQMVLSGIPIELLAAAKVICHWLITFVPLLIMTPLLALLLNLTIDTTLVLITTLLFGTPVMSLLGAIAVALTVDLRKSALILPLILLPIFIPLLIFATSAINSATSQLPYTPQLAIIAAIFMFTCAIAPSAIAYGLKVSQH